MQLTRLKSSVVKIAIRITMPEAEAPKNIWNYEGVLVRSISRT